MILVINKSRMRAATLAEALHIMGLLAFPATPEKALSEIDLAYSAVILMEPDSLADPRDYLSRIRTYHKTIPIFAISDSGNDYSEIAECFEKSRPAWQIANDIIEYQEARCLPLIGCYRLSSLRAEAYEESVKYFGEDIPLTKTEAMIIRYLIKSYPTPKTAREIISHANRPSRSPSEASVRTFVSLINSKFKKVSGENIVRHESGKGYTILTTVMAI